MLNIQVKWDNVDIFYPVNNYLVTIDSCTDKKCVTHFIRFKTHIDYVYKEFAHIFNTEMTRINLDNVNEVLDKFIINCTTPSLICIVIPRIFIMYDMDLYLHK